MVDLLSTVDNWADEIPLEDQSNQRFGNKAYPMPTISLFFAVTIERSRRAAPSATGRNFCKPQLTHMAVYATRHRTTCPT